MVPAAMVLVDVAGTTRIRVGLIPIFPIPPRVQPLMPRQFVFPPVLVSVSNHKGIVLNELEIGVYRLFRLGILKQFRESAGEKHCVKRANRIYLQFAGNFQTIWLAARNTQADLMPSKRSVKFAHLRVFPSLDSPTKHAGLCWHSQTPWFVLGICTDLYKCPDWFERAVSAPRSTFSASSAILDHQRAFFSSLGANFAGLGNIRP
jgi:hypothetical protein